jgi:hypothetical protein
MYSLLYYTKDGGLIETVLYSAPYAVCKWKANQLCVTTHKLGIFKISKP